jgi:uncharacterized repeat protein (TIGR03803 family)
MSKFNWGMRACGVLLLWAAAAVSLPAQTTTAALPTQTFTSLHSFNNDGAYPYAGLVQGTNGNLYGTTMGSGQGTVFKISPGGKLTTLYNFCSQRDCTDGAYPYAELVLATNGNFYGTTVGGGAYGGGTVYNITPNGKLTTLYNFCLLSKCADGANPYAGLVQDTNGRFYGTTYSGGISTCYLGCGTVFKIDLDGTLTTIYNFCSQSSCGDGAAPYAGVTEGTNGAFYGTTSAGGANNSCYNGNIYGCGTVFKITSSGALTTLYYFCSDSNCADGAVPLGGLVQAVNGEIYGTTTVGGGPGYGTVFKIAPGSMLTTLHTFDLTDGANPYAKLAQGTDGNFYGTTVHGGANCQNQQEDGCGIVFSMTPSGKLTTLYNLCSRSYCPDGANPYAGLIQATNGTFYGTTVKGGTSRACIGCGTVFSLSVGLGPFVETQPTSGEVGKAVKILGTDLTDATSVTFNGTAATFTVKSKSEITTTVPAGATTGKVRVTFPRGTRSSNVVFRVR